MRAVLISLLVAASAIVAATSGAAAARYAKADAALVRDGDETVGGVHSRRSGEDKVETGVQRDDVSIRRGEAVARTGRGALGFATAAAYEVDMLGGRVVAAGVRRTAERTADGLDRRGGVYGLRVDGRFVGDVRDRRVITFDGGKVTLNTGDSGLRVVTDDADIRVAVATATTVKAPEPTATPTPTATAAPTAAPTAKPTAAPTQAPKRRKAPSVKRRLTKGGYAFPVYGDKVRVADNFGATRAAPITIHQGNDIFAPFGSPVVAVRDGKIDHVGTLPISGNRLWLHTANGDAFFYAHLSAFSDAAVNRARVKAGTVLGFVGNTGDAEPTPPHVHFEVHPGGMDSDAVDPYPIVSAWQRRDDVPPGAWLQQLGADATQRPGALITVRDFIAE